MNKYAVISIEHFNREELQGVYSIVDEREHYVLIEYTTETNPTGEHWVIFSGEGANVKCAEYLQTLEPSNTQNIQKLYFSTPEERDAFNAAEAEFAGADPSVPYLETGQDELGYYLLVDVIAKPNLWQRFKNLFG